ncbi:MAG: DEAD/DEAH box helicase [Gammaproteobacteria bacterium]|nr:DEAD/DEAH box helicase [Gammaproteobacteria bacterium]MDH5801695.1 DEAD/DEAH box helicase [Gammaproteobacteria bacterium]
MSLELFHPAVAAWFNKSFAAPTRVQLQSWPTIAQQHPTLIAAPTGSGKTLAAFLASINELVVQGVERGLPEHTQILYVSPLKALSNDIQKNLQQPINGIRDSLLEHGLADVEIKAWVRTGDTPQAERVRMRKNPPHILVSTPESLYILLSSDSGREMLKSIKTVIVDEIHALAGSKRGSHLLLSLQRLDALCQNNNRPAPVRIGLSATQKPIERMAQYLNGSDQPCTIVDTGHSRARDLQIEVTASPLEAVMANETWEEIYSRLQELVQQHRTTLIFVNTRRLAERAARHLAERIGEEHVTAHHGSLAREHRLQAEQRLKNGQLKALVATASLELGIDIGDVDLVCQLGSPRSIAAFLQRVGRSGHAVGATPKGRLFPLSRDDLIECSAMLDAIGKGELDQILIPHQPLDVLAQHIVAEVACAEWDELQLYDRLRQAWTYRDLSQQEFSDVVQMLADGYTTKRGRRGAYLHRDGINGKLRPRRGARLTALTNGGAIPDQFDYDVMLQPEGCFIGSLNEDFAFESLPGDIFQLGNTSYRILKIESGRVYVEDAHGQPPNIPFWFGEAPGRTDELSQAVARLNTEFARQLDLNGLEGSTQWLQQQLHLPAFIAEQISHYLATAKAALGVLPSMDTVIFERFFDDVGDMHFVIHAPFGSRINRAWGLSLRKRFCRKFNFELQAAANENNIVLSLGPTHSFPLEEVANYLNANTVRHLLVQALLDAPMFGTRWRWNANISLAVPRNRNGKKVPAQFQRSDAEDLVAVIFPDQLACFENISGEREVPEHPLVQQTIGDCLHETMDIEGLEQVLQRLTSGAINVVCRDLPTPSPLAAEIINAKAYAFLDDAPAEERRTLAIRQRQLDPQSAQDIGRLSPEAIARVRQEAWPEVYNADELHDALSILGFVTDAEMQKSAAWNQYLEALTQQQRCAPLLTGNGKTLWCATERLPNLLLLHPQGSISETIKNLLAQWPTGIDADTALVDMIRSRLEGLGPVSATQLAQAIDLNLNAVQTALLALEQEGFAIQGYFESSQDELQWCDRGLLARIHRYTLKSLRREVQAVSPAVFMRFLFYWHHLVDPGEGKQALIGILDQLEGYAVPAAAWESEVLPARLEFYLPEWLDSLCNSGHFAWLRAGCSKKSRKSSPVKMTPVYLLPRETEELWGKKATDETDDQALSEYGAQVLRLLNQNGASFFADLVKLSGLLRTQVETALGELVNRGLVTSDNFAGLRALITPSSRKPAFRSRSRSGRNRQYGVDEAGRWSLIQRQTPSLESQSRLQQLEDWQHIAWTLLMRYGVVFRKLLDNETDLPPWRDLLYMFRRMEARGEIRGGRFVSGFAGEQFALPDAVQQLRSLNRDQQSTKDPAATSVPNELVTLSAVDPLNLTGIITPGKRVPAQLKNRILYRNGVPLALYVGGNVEFLDEVDTPNQWDLRNRLIRKHNPAYVKPPGDVPS